MVATVRATVGATVNPVSLRPHARVVDEGVSNLSVRTEEVRAGSRVHAHILTTVPLNR